MNQSELMFFKIINYIDIIDKFINFERYCNYLYKV